MILALKVFMVSSDKTDVSFHTYNKSINSVVRLSKESVDSQKRERSLFILFELLI